MRPRYVVGRPNTRPRRRANGPVGHRGRGDADDTDGAGALPVGERTGRRGQSFANSVRVISLP